MRLAVPVPGSSRQVEKWVVMVNFGTPIVGTDKHVFSVCATDLGIAYVRADGSTGYVFGDSFDVGFAGPNWRSPVILYGGSSPYPVVNFTQAYGGYGVSQVIRYQHNSNNGGGWEGTRIPNDAIVINGLTYLHAVSVNNWSPPAGSDGSNFSQVVRFDENHDTVAPVEVLHFAGDTQGRAMSEDGVWTFGGWQNGHLYIFSKRWGRGNSGEVYLSRCTNIEDLGTYEHWAFVNGGWSWNSTAVPCTRLFGASNIGELSVRLLGDTWVMSYLDLPAGGIVTRRASAPDGVWSDPKVQVYGSRPWWYWLVGKGGPVWPQCYGGYIHPRSTADNLTLLISQWNTSTNNPYHVIQFDGLVA